MLRGTNVLWGEDARRFTATLQTLRDAVAAAGFEEIIVPAIWERRTFTDKLGVEKEAQMWTFEDKGGRECCLVPEVTGIVQELWNERFFSSRKLPVRLFYVARCYRYERPQAGRYREFTQFGVEILGGDAKEAGREARSILKGALSLIPGEFAFVESVQRGLSYYVEDGFEVECSALGAQKQVAGGGRYPEGTGWAIGVERLVLASKRCVSDETSVCG